MRRRCEACPLTPSAIRSSSNEPRYAAAAPPPSWLLPQARGAFSLPLGQPAVKMRPSTQSVGVFGSFVLAAFAVLLSGCERPPDIDRPNFFDKDGIAFSFPGNWSVSEDVTEPGELECRYLFVESPGDAIVIIQRFTPEIDLTVQEFADQFLQSTIEEAEGLIDLGPVTPVTASGGQATSVQTLVAGAMREGVEQSFAVSVLGEAVGHRSRTFRIEAASSVAFLVAQAATEDWDIVAPGFELIATTLSVK